MEWNGLYLCMDVRMYVPIDYCLLACLLVSQLARELDWNWTKIEYPS